MGYANYLAPCLEGEKWSINVVFLKEKEKLSFSKNKQLWIIFLVPGAVRDWDLQLSQYEALCDKGCENYTTKVLWEFRKGRDFNFL